MKNIHILPTDKKTKNVGDLVKDQYVDIHIFTKHEGKEYGKPTTILNSQHGPYWIVCMVTMTSIG
jgi:hypothetical protein